MTFAGASPVLALAGVAKAFVAPSGSHVVLDGVDLEVRPGEVVAIAGRSGSGKTTLLSVITGWDAPDSGSIEFLGVPLRADRPWQELAILPQSLGLLDELTVAENVLLPLRLASPVSAAAGGENEDPQGLLADLGIAHLADRYPSEVSLGEQQRAALARAAVLRPALLVADEPISHQNREWAEVMVVLLGRLAALGTACVLATHNEIAFVGADRILELADGRLQPRSTTEVEA